MAQTASVGLSGDGWTLNSITFSYDSGTLIADVDGDSEYGILDDSPRLVFAASGNPKAEGTYTAGGFRAQRAAILKDGPPYTVSVGPSASVDVTEAVEAVLPSGGSAPANIQVTEAGTSLWGSVSDRGFSGSDPNLGSLGRVTPGQEAAIEVAAKNYGESRGTARRQVSFNGEQVGAVEFDLPPGDGSRAVVRFVVPSGLSNQSVSWSAGRREFESAVDLPEDDPAQEQSKLEVQNFRALAPPDSERSATARFEVVNVPLTSSGASESGTAEVTLDGEVAWTEDVEVGNRQSRSFEVVLEDVEPGEREICARVS